MGQGLSLCELVSCKYSCEGPLTLSLPLPQQVEDGARSEVTGRISFASYHYRTNGPNCGSQGPGGFWVYCLPPHSLPPLLAWSLGAGCVVGLCPVVRQWGGGSLGTGNSWVWGNPCRQPSQASCGRPGSLCRGLSILCLRLRQGLFDGK